MGRPFETTDEASAEEQWERQTAARLESACRAGEAAEKLAQARRATKQQPSQSDPRD